MKEPQPKAALIDGVEFLGSLQHLVERDCGMSSLVGHSVIKVVVSLFLRTFGDIPIVEHKVDLSANTSPSAQTRFSSHHS